MIHLFIHIVTYPSLPSVASDIQLIDMAASYFGHLDYSTGSSFALGFIRDLVHWARVRTTSASADKSNIAKPVTRPVSPITNALNFLPAGMDEFFSNQVSGSCLVYRVLKLIAALELDFRYFQCPSS